MNINTLDWDKPLLKFFGISAKCLPTIKTSSEVYGNISGGYLNNTPISCIIGNCQAALIGQKCFRRGLTKGILDKNGSIFTIDLSTYITNYVFNIYNAIVLQLYLISSKFQIPTLIKIFMKFHPNLFIIHVS